MAVRSAGPSRAAILIGTARDIGADALTLLGEPFHVALLAGTVLIVAGGVALTASASVRTTSRARSGARALCASALRGAPKRPAVGGARPAPLRRRAATSLLGAAICWRSTSSSSGAGAPREAAAAALPFAPAGIALAGGYVCCSRRSRTARQRRRSAHATSRSGGGLAAIVLRTTDAIGSRLVLTSVLIVAGGALIRHHPLSGRQASGLRSPRRLARRRCPRVARLRPSRQTSSSAVISCPQPRAPRSGRA